MAKLLRSLGININMFPTSNSMEGAREQVLGDDDLLTEILLKMPLKSIYKSRFVSKRWNALISSILFLENLKARTVQNHESEKLPPLLNFMLASPSRSWFNIEQLHYDDNNYSSCCTTCENIQTKPAVLSGYEQDFLFRASSNCLILTGSYYGKDRWYRVVNLQTKEFLKLPHLYFKFLKKVSVALVYEEVESHQAMAPNYKVVVAPAEIDGDELVDVLPMLPILIYSSHTGCWTKSCMRSQHGIFSLKCFKPPVLLNGFLHWYCDPWGIAVMDTKNMVNRTKMIDIELIPLPHIPTTTMEPYFNFGFTRTSCDDLWFGAIDEWATLTFWRLSMGKHSNNISTQIGMEEWILMESVDIVSLASCSLPRLLCQKCNINFRDFSTWMGMFKIEALIPWKSDIIVLLRLTRGDGAATFVYNRQSKSLELVCCYEWGDLTHLYESYTVASGLEDSDGEVDGPDGEHDDPDGELDDPDDELDDPDGQQDAPNGELDNPDDELDDPNDELDDPDGEQYLPVDETLRLDFAYCGWSPIMDPLTLSSYGVLKHKPSSLWRCLTCYCEECSALVQDKIGEFFSMFRSIFLVICVCKFIALFYSYYFYYFRLYQLQ